MNNRSNIQLQLESIHAKGEFAKQLHNILEKYDVQDTVFGIHRGLYELSSGYFVESKTYDDLDLAIREMENGQAIRVVESAKFILGDVYQNISDCPEDSHIFNIEYLEDVC